MKTKTTKPKPALMASVMPKTDAEWAAYRCKLSCKIGKDALDGKTKIPTGVSPIEYAVYNLLCAVEELSAQNKHEQRKT